MVSVSGSTSVMEVVRGHTPDYMSRIQPNGIVDQDFVDGLVLAGLSVTVNETTWSPSSGGHAHCELPWDFYGITLDDEDDEDW